MTGLQSDRIINRLQFNQTIINFNLSASHLKQIVYVVEIENAIPNKLIELISKRSHQPFITFYILVQAKRMGGKNKAETN